MPRALPLITIVLLAVTATASGQHSLLHHEDDLGNRVSTFRCGSDVVALGDLAFHVRQDCGEPEFEETVEVVVEEAARRLDVAPGVEDQLRIARIDTVERWYYQLSRNRLPRVLTIRGGRVVRIEVLESR